MEFRVLGPLQAIGGDGAPCALEPRQQRLLAALLLTANRVVTRQYLIDAVWDDTPPATAARQLKNLVSGLRQRLKEAGALHPIVVTEGPGYVARLAGSRLDAVEFEKHLARAQTLHRDGRSAEAKREVRAALELWQGPALAGCSGRAIEAAAARLNEQRLTALEHRFDLELELGQHEAVVSELTELVALHPLRERLVGQLMLALHRSGRQADSLAAYQKARTSLADDLGIDPGAALQKVHAIVLRGDETAVAPAAAPARREHDLGATPRQLPSPPRTFVGRLPELKDLNRLADDATTGKARSVVIAAVTGSGGIGKTSLALHWAHQVANKFPDGQLYLNLRGFDPSGVPLSSQEAIRHLLDAFAVAAERIPLALDSQVALYRSLVADRLMLIVLDNARDAEHVRPLLPGTPGCLVVVTSRRRLTGLATAHGAYPVNLDLLTDGEARDLLAGHLGPERLAAERHATDRLTAACAGLPLALSIVAARAAALPNFPLSTLAAQLTNAHGILDVLDTADHSTQPRSVFSWSYQQLSEPAARLFRLMGLHPGPDISATAAGSLANNSGVETRRALSELTQAHLLNPLPPDRYSMHDLLRAYAGEQAHLHDTEDTRQTALRLVFDHYLHTAHVAAAQLNPFQDPVAIPATPAATVPAPRTVAEAVEWMDREYQVLLAAIRLAAVIGFESHASRLAWFLTEFFDRRGRWHDWAEIQTIALEAALRDGDLAGQARGHRSLGRAHHRLGRLDDATADHRHALEAYRTLGDLIGQAHSYINSCRVLEDQLRYPDALQHATNALELYRAGAHPAGQATALNGIGWLQLHLGNPRDAYDRCSEALILHQAIGHVEGQASTLDSLGYIQSQLGDHDAAIASFRRALKFREQTADRYGTAIALEHLGDAYVAVADPTAGGEAWQEALSILDQLNHPRADNIRGKLRTFTSPGAKIGELKAAATGKADGEAKAAAITRTSVTGEDRRWRGCTTERH